MTIKKRKRSPEPYRRRLILNLPPEFDIAIAQAAALKGITRSKYVLQAVAEQLIKDKIHE